MAKELSVVLGATILAAVLVGVFVAIARISGWRVMAFVLASTLGLGVVLGAGIALLSWGLS
jgi:hypothetical protein